MTAPLLLAAFLGTAWLLYRLVDWGYRRNLGGPEQRTPAVPAPAPLEPGPFEPAPPEPARAPVLTRP